MTPRIVDLLSEAFVNIQDQLWEILQQEPDTYEIVIETVEQEFWDLERRVKEVERMGAERVTCPRCGHTWIIYGKYWDLWLRCPACGYDFKPRRVKVVKAVKA